MRGEAAMRGGVKASVLLCIDEESARNPALLGLPDLPLDSLGWLRVETDPFSARRAMREDGGICQAWVFGSDSMEGVNLAAALKRDDPAAQVCCLSFERSGSLFGKCEAAGVIPVFGRTEFLRMFEHARQHESQPRSEALGEGGEDSSRPSMQDTGPLPRIDGFADDVAVDASLPNLDIEEPKGLGVPPSACEPEKTSQRAKTESRPTDVSNEPELAGKKGFVVCVASASGGTGKSALATVMALLLHQAGRKTLLLDGDAQFGDCRSLLGNIDAVSLQELMVRPEMASLLEPNEGLPALIQPPERLEQCELVAEELPELVGALASGFDVVVVDTGSRWDESQVRLLLAADRTVLLSDQRPSSVRTTARLLDFCGRAGIPLQRFEFALNLCSKQAFMSAMDVSCALNGVKVHELADGGSEVSELLGAGLPLEMLEADAAFTQSVALLLAQMLPDGINPFDVEELAGGKRSRKKRKKRR